MSDFYNYNRSKNYHERKRQNFSDWKQMNDKNVDNAQPAESNSNEIDDRHTKKTSKSRSRSVTRVTTTNTTELSKSMKRHNSNDSENQVTDDVEQLKRELKNMTKNFNKAKNEKTKAYNELIKEKDRSRRFEKDAQFWREECYKKQTNASNESMSSKQTDCLEKLFSLSIAHAKMAENIMRNDLEYDFFDVKNLIAVGEKSIPINNSRIKIDNLNKYTNRQTDEIKIYNKNLKIVSSIARSESRKFLKDDHGGLLTETRPAKEQNLLDEGSSLEG